MGDTTNFPNIVNVGTLSISDTIVTATAAQINAAVGGGVSNVTAATYTVGSTDVGKLITLNRAAGIAVTLPAATGSGTKYQFFVGTTITSNTTTITRAGTDTIFGNAYMATDGASNAVVAYEAGGASVITLNGTTKGGYKGDMITLIDAAAGVWSVVIAGAATGTVVTPFS